MMRAHAVPEPGEGHPPREQIAHACRIAGLGYGESVIELALRRRGVQTERAAIIALSVVSARGDARAAGTDAEAARSPRPVIDASAATAAAIDLQAARAAQRALGALCAFVFYIALGLGGGLAAGWTFGFDRGVEDGLDSLQRALAQIVLR